MKRISILTSSAIVLALLLILFIIFDQPIIAAAFGLLAYAIALYGMKQETAYWQGVAYVLISLCFGYAISQGGIYFHLIACFLFLSLLITTRVYAQLLFTQMVWLEPLYLLLALGAYIFGNIHYQTGWVAWVFPIGPFLHAALKTYGGLIDYTEFKKAEYQHYAADLGKQAPQFSLPDSEGKVVNLSDYKGKRHVLLIFVRGDWCPTCHIMLRTYEKNKNKFLEKNIIIVAIGPDPVGVNRDMVIRLGLDYKLLSDDKREAAKMYGTQSQENNSMTKYFESIPLPAAFLVDINGMIAYTSSPKKAGEVLYPDTIFPVIDAL